MIDMPPPKTRRVQPLAQAAVIVSTATLTANRQERAEFPDPFIVSPSYRVSEPSPTSCSREVNAIEYTSTQFTTPPNSNSNSNRSSPPIPHLQVPPAPSQPITNKLPPDLAFGRKLEWSADGIPIEPPPGRHLPLPLPLPRRCGGEPREQRPVPRRTSACGLHPFDCHDAFANRSPVHVTAYPVDPHHGRRTSSAYHFSSEESLSPSQRRKNISSSPRKSAHKEP